MDWHYVFCGVFAAFNLSYALLSVFAVDWLSELLFNEPPPTGNAWRYFTSGAGFVCIALVMFAIVLVHPKAPIELQHFHVRCQVGIWIGWCIWEAYWLKEGSNLVIGLLQMGGCVTTLGLAAAAKYQLEDKIEDASQASQERLQGVLAGENRR